jgi:transposase
MKTISMDIRTRIVEAYDQGNTTRQGVADRFGVSLAFVKKILSRRKRFGTIAPFHDHAGRKRAISPDQEKALREHLAAHPGDTLAELRDALGLACSLATVFYALRRMKLTYKKKRSAPPNRTARKSRPRGKAGPPGARNGLANASSSSTNRPRRPK